MMKRIFAIVLLCALFTGARAQRSTLTATLTGVPAGMPVVVAEAHGGRLVPTDTLRADKKGRYRLERYSHQPQMLVLGLEKEQSPVVHLLMLPGEKIGLELAYVPELNAIDITATEGSANMSLYRQFTGLNIRAARQRNPQLVADSLAVLLEAQPSFLMSALLVTFYEQSFDQYAGLYKKIRDALAADHGEHEFVKHLDSRLQTVLLAGMEAPEIALPSPTGDTLRLSSLRGKVVLIDFWASWCGPCRRENPHVVRLYQRFREKGFEVFSVSLDQQHAAWVKAIRDDGLVWPNHVSDLRGWQSAAGRRYGINSVPSTVLVDAQGRILARNLRGEELERTLKNLFEP